MLQTGFLLVGLALVARSCISILTASWYAFQLERFLDDVSEGKAYTIEETIPITCTLVSLRHAHKGNAYIDLGLSCVALLLGVVLFVL